jgi:hypothetical protein
MNITFPIHRVADGALPTYLEKKLGGVRTRTHVHRHAQVYLASSLGGVSLAAVNGTYQVQAAQTWLMLFALQFQPANVSVVSGLWEKVCAAMHTHLCAVRNYKN